MRYHDITADDMKNGDGLRAVLWVSGCDHGCPGCHNPITWSCEGGLVFDEKAERELMGLIARDYISGLTLSGGDPLHPVNRNEVERLCQRVKENYPDKTIWLYTGYLWEEIQGLPLMKNIDVCVDGRYIEAEADIKLKWRGSANQRVIDVKGTLDSGQVKLHCD